MEALFRASSAEGWVLHLRFCLIPLYLQGSMATDKYATTSSPGSLLSVPRAFGHVWFSITFWYLEAVKAYQRKRDPQKPRSYARFLVCKPPMSWLVAWPRRLGTSRKRQSDSRSRTQASSLPVACPSCRISAPKFLHLSVCYLFPSPSKPIPCLVFIL